MYNYDLGAQNGNVAFSYQRKNILEQIWVIHIVNSNIVVIQNAKNGQCLDSEDGKIYQILNCTNPRKSQFFKLEPR
jgi:hypothetical protein